MPSPIMFTEAAFLFGANFEARRPMPCRDGRQLETWAKMQGSEIGRLDPAVLRDALGMCARCACRKACRRWLRTGVFKYCGRFAVSERRSAAPLTGTSSEPPPAPGDQRAQQSTLTTGLSIAADVGARSYLPPGFDPFET
jgi:hypothetical protein